MSVELFTTIKFEMKIAGVWTDITADVLQNPRPRVDGMGIMGSGINDRVGDIGTLSFSLNNSASNTAGLLGYYSPSNDNSFLTNTVTGIEVRLYFEYNGVRRYKFYGRVYKDGWQVIPGKYKERRVDVVVQNWMKRASDTELDLMGYALDKRFEEGVQLVLNNMDVRPQNTSFSTGTVTFPTLFDVTRTNTKAIGEINKMVMSEMGFAFIAGDGTNGETLKLQSFQERLNLPDADADQGSYIPVKMSDVTDILLLVSGDDLLLVSGASDNILLNNRQRASFTEADIQAATIQYNKNYFNYATIKTYPRTVDAAATTVLWALSVNDPAEEPIEIAAGEQALDIRGAFRDPDNPDTQINGIEMVTPVSGTDWKAFANADGTGTNYTTSVTVVADYGTADVRYTITNNAAVTVYVTLLQARGKGVKIYSPNEKTFKALSAGAPIVKVDIDLLYTPGASQLDVLFDGITWFSTTYATESPKFDTVTMFVNKSSKAMLAFMHIEPGMAMTFTETVSGLGIDVFLPNQVGWFVNGYSFEIIDGKYVKWTCVLKFPTEQ